MSTLTEVDTSYSRRAPISRILRRLLLAVLLILVGAVLYLWFVAHSALPQLDGRLQIAGLSAPVTVTRDAHGVPTIEAATLDDLFFAQGYVTAQDRLWQMDIMRRFGSGELSEILGEDTLKHRSRAANPRPARRGGQVARHGQPARPRVLRGLRARRQRLHRDPRQQAAD